MKRLAIISGLALSVLVPSVISPSPASFILPCRADVSADETTWTKLIDDALRYDTLGQSDLAEATYQQAATEAKKIDDNGPHVIRTLINLADLQIKMKKYKEAEASIREAQKAAQSMSGREGLNWQICVLGELADFYSAQDMKSEHDQATAEEKKIDALITKDTTDFSGGFSRLQYNVRKNWHPPRRKVSLLSTVAWRTEKNGHFELVHLHQSSGNAETDEAAIAAVRALSDTSALPPTTLGPVDMQMDFAYNAWNKDGTQVPAAYAKKGDSIEDSLKVVDDAEAAVGPDSPNLIALLLSLGYSYESVKRYPDAERAFERALKIYQKNNLTDRVVLGNIYCLLGHNEAAIDQLDKSEKSFKEALKATEDTLNPSVVNARAQVLSEYKALLFRKGKNREASQLK